LGPAAVTASMLGAEFNAGSFSQPFRVNFVLALDRPELAAPSRQGSRGRDRSRGEQPIRPRQWSQQYLT